MRPLSLWILSLGFVVLAVPANATPRGAQAPETRHGKRDHPPHARVVERDTLSIQWDSNGRAARSHNRPIMNGPIMNRPIVAPQIRNDDLAKAFSKTDQSGRSTVSRRPTQPSLAVIPGRWQERNDFSNIPSRRFYEDSSSSPTPRLIPENEASAAPVPEPTAAMLFGGGLVLVYTLAAVRRERI